VAPHDLCRLLLHAGAPFCGAPACLLGWRQTDAPCRRWGALSAVLLLALALVGCGDASPPPPTQLGFIHSREFAPGLIHTTFTKAIDAFEDARDADLSSKTEASRNAAIDRAIALVLLTEQPQVALELLDAATIPFADPLQSRSLFIYMTRAGTFAQAMRHIERSRASGRADLPDRERLLQAATRVHLANTRLIKTLNPMAELLSHLVGELRSAAAEGVEPKPDPK
jgi:hypothetical protein